MKSKLICSGASPEKIKNDLKPLVNFKSKGISLEEISELIHEKLLPHLVNYNHPNFISLYNFFPEQGAKLGAEIALEYNQGVTNWQVSPGGVMVEELCCKALCGLFGLDSEADATFMYCGTYSNQSALYLALHWTAEVIYGFDFSEKGITGFPNPNQVIALTSKDTHLSIKHALRFLGLGEKNLITIPVDDKRRIDVLSLKETLKKLQTIGKEIFCVITTAGTTSTGSIDPIMPIARLCNKEKIWNHVDAAYGLSYSLVPEKRIDFEGLSLADSITWDPHKTFGVPIPNSLLFVRNKRDFERMSIYGDYFNRKNDIEPNPGLKSPPTTRPLSSLPLVTTILHSGLQGVISKFNTHILTTQKAYKNLKKDNEIEILLEPELSILCLRLIPENIPEHRLNQLQQFIYDQTKKNPTHSISITKLDDKLAIRLVILNENVTVNSIMDTIQHLKKLASQYNTNNNKITVEK